MESVTNLFYRAGGNPSIYYSTDGITLLDSGFSNDGAGSTIGYNGSNWLIVVDNTLTAGATAFLPTTPSNYTGYQIDPSNTLSQTNSIAWNGSAWLVAGRENIGFRNALYRSTDGISWSNIQMVNELSNVSTGTVRGKLGLFVVFGKDGFDSVLSNTPILHTSFTYNIRDSIIW
jgi:hypothetical protein